MVFLFWICASVVIPCVYSLPRYFWDFILEVSVRLLYMGCISMLILMRYFFEGECTGGNGNMYFVLSFE